MFWNDKDDSKTKTPKLEFKFKIGSLVSDLDGNKGKICSQIFKDFKIVYGVLLDSDGLIHKRKEYELKIIQ